MKAWCTIKRILCQHLIVISCDIHCTHPAKKGSSCHTVNNSSAEATKSRVWVCKRKHHCQQIDFYGMQHIWNASLWPLTQILKNLFWSTLGDSWSFVLTKIHCYYSIWSCAHRIKSMSLKADPPGEQITLLTHFFFTVISSTQECFLCESSVLVRFQPCGHSSLCNVCGKKAKRCPECKVGYIYNYSWILSATACTVQFYMCLSLILHV